MFSQITGSTRPAGLETIYWDRHSKKREKAALSSSCPRMSARMSKCDPTTGSTDQVVHLDVEFGR